MIQFVTKSLMVNDAFLYQKQYKNDKQKSSM